MCHGSGTATWPQGAGLSPGLWRNSASVWTQKLYLQEAWCYLGTEVNLRGMVCVFTVLFTWNHGEYTALHISHSRVCLGSEEPGFSGHHRHSSANTACFIASEIKSSQSAGSQMGKKLEPVFWTSPSPHSCSASFKAMLLSWLSLTLCMPICIDSSSALNHFCSFTSLLGYDELVWLYCHQRIH